MSRNRILILTIVLLVTLAACTLSPDAAEPGAARIVISEVQTGAEGNNNDEFIELYNAGGLLTDLNGWSLAYGLHPEDADLLVFQWDSLLLIPPHGHILLARSGAAAENMADGIFTQSLNNSFGGLALLNAEGVRIDSIGWGEGTAPETFVEGAPAPGLENGLSLERLPGGKEGSAQDSDDNAADFVLRENPDPQSSGSPFTPGGPQTLEMTIIGPASVEPGQSLALQISLTNPSDTDLRNLEAIVPVDPALSIAAIYQGGSMDGSDAFWRIENLPAHESITLDIELAAPWRYFTAWIQNARVVNAAGELLDFAGTLQTAVEGGTLPIQIARGMIGEEVTVEGVATMYTGGFYAGSGAKFYLQDATGGAQIYVSGAGGILNVPIGALVRVRGSVLLYNNSIEIAPVSADDVEIISLQGENAVPLQVEIPAILADPDVYTGQLVQVEGRATRIEEFSYSYEIDISTDDGEVLTLYVDELTLINIERLDLNHMYRMTGIPEWRSTALYLNPRIDSDLEEIYPPGVRLDVSAPGSILPGEEAVVTITVYNDLPGEIEHVDIDILVPAQGGTITGVLDGGEQVDDALNWFIEALPGGASIDLHYTILAPSLEGEVLIEDLVVTYSGAEGLTFGPGRTIFVGGGVPIWAIQGDGEVSPYKLEEVVVQGVVTGVFPELGGFWLQDEVGDDDPATSDGIFINFEDPEPDVAIGDRVRVSGTVRESAQQTQIAPASLAAIVVLNRGQALPESIYYAPPADNMEAARYNEALEGMLVTVAGPARAIAPTSAYGEFVLVLDNYPGERVWRGEPTGMLITVDDGSSVTHSNRSMLGYVVAVGDRVSAVTGPLAFTYGGYKIEPNSPPVVTNEEVVLPVLPAPADNGFSLMTWNVENLFDILNPHPSSPVIPTAGEYQLDLTKIANTILSAGAPTIIALQEVENLAILQDLAEHELLSDYNYQAYLLEGTDSRGIDVGYLVRGDRVSVTLVEQRDAPGEMFSRPPLLLQATITTSNGEVEIYLLNNHFLSLSAGEELTEPRRTGQAAWNGGIVEAILSEHPDAVVAVLGDLNSFYATAPLETLAQAGLTHIYDMPGMLRGYSYIFEGASQTLDHILISDGLGALFLEYQILHVNADFPPAIPDDPSPMRQSDHDPVVAWFLLP
ncbi:MAG: lamin tail domain-containing protein [Anaerolineales bacterium]|nr:lamin tail domain-containing protein [Anaerolineales bacterium]